MIGSPVPTTSITACEQINGVLTDLKFNGATCGIGDTSTGTPLILAPGEKVDGVKAYAIFYSSSGNT